MIQYIDLQNALRVYCDPQSNIQAQSHIKPMHYYSALRLVLEGGFDPANILPRPPFSSIKQTQEKYLLQYALSLPRISGHN